MVNGFRVHRLDETKDHRQSLLSPAGDSLNTAPLAPR